MVPSFRRFRLLLSVATAITSLPAQAKDAPGPTQAASVPSLEDQFRDPPNSARPRVWWHWMNGNVTKDGIAKDLAWMKRVGIGGLQNFDANLMTPQIVEDRLVYMLPDWKDAFRFAVSEADRLGLEFAIAASPGFSETGGPWVKPEDGLKKLVWSQTDVAGGRQLAGRLGMPPIVTGPFQSLPASGDFGETPESVKAASYYADVAVLAYPVDGGAAAVPTVRDGNGRELDARPLVDSDMDAGLTLMRGKDGLAPSIIVDYATPRTIHAASIFVKGAAVMFVGPVYSARLEASDDGKAWRTISDVPLARVPTTIAFAPVSARQFRIAFSPIEKAGLSQGQPAPGVAVDVNSGFTGGGIAPLNIADFRLFESPRIDRYEAKAGFDIASDYYALSTSAPDLAGIAPASIVDLTSRLRPDGTLDWKPPRLADGRKWRILRLGYSLVGTTNHPAPLEATGLEVDKFDAAAVRRYLDHYIGMYKDAAGPDMIGAKGVSAILTDSIEVGAANWTPQMISQFKRLRGYDPKLWLPALTGVVIGSRSKSDRFLYDYRRTLADLMASEHYGTVARVAHENGLKVYGEALEDRRPSLGDDMEMRRHADVPMAAMWTYAREEGPKPTFLADIKGAASVAHIYGQNLVAAESMTASMNPWNYAPRDLKRVIDLTFVTGVNRAVVHTSVHQPVDDKIPGLSLFIFGQYFNRHETWANLAKPWVDYMARNALMLQQGRNVADVGYFYGEEGPLTALYGDKAVVDAPKANAYDFVNAAALNSVLTNEGNELVTPGGARYRVLYLGGSSRQMTLSTLRKLAALVDGGAIVVGVKPEGDPGLAGDAAEYAALTARLWSSSKVTQVGKGRVIPSADIEAALDRIGVAPDFRFTGGQGGADIPFVHRRLADGDSYFLANRKDRTETILAHFRVIGKAPELWHAETGTSEPASYRISGDETVVPLTLGADESVHVVFRKPALADSLTIKKPVPTPLAELDGAWTVNFQKDRGAPASVTLPALTPLNESADPGIKYFSGVAAYIKDFTAPRGWRPGNPLWIDLGDVRELAEVTVNGVSVGSAWHPPFRLDIGSAVRRGRNRLVVRVANLWVNRLIGDAQPGASKITYTAIPSYKTDAPLRPSGLIGPVTLLLGQDPLQVR